MYNAVHVFISIGVSTYSTRVGGVRSYIFQFQGELKHLLESLLLTKGMFVVCSQLYIIDTKNL